jgi:hypothetical protein
MYLRGQLFVFFPDTQSHKYGVFNCGKRHGLVLKDEYNTIWLFSLWGHLCTNFTNGKHISSINDA